MKLRIFANILFYYLQKAVNPGIQEMMKFKDSKTPVFFLFPGFTFLHLIHTSSKLEKFQIAKLQFQIKHNNLFYSIGRSKRINLDSKLQNTNLDKKPNKHHQIHDFLKRIPSTNLLSFAFTNPQVGQ